MFGILECVKELHELDIIHRDLTPNHFMKHPNGEVILIDFGSAYFINSKQELDTSKDDITKFCRYNGSIEFAADQILEYLSDLK